MKTNVPACLYLGLSLSALAQPTPPGIAPANRPYPLSPKRPVVDTYFGNAVTVTFGRSPKRNEYHPLHMP